MASYAYIARDDDGARVTGELTAASEQAALAELHSRALSPLQLRAVRGPRRSARTFSTRKLATAYRQMSDLLRAGVPLLRALRLLGRSKSNPRLATVMNEIADAVADGARLGDAMDDQGEIFPPIQLAMIRAGERGGFLEQVLNRLGTFLEAQADFRAKVVGNLIYPVVLLVVVVLVVVAAMIFFVPKFQGLFEGQMATLPVPTRILLGSSAFITTYWALILLALAALVVGWLLIRKRDRVQRTIAHWQLAVPKLGPLLRSVAVARFARLLGTLLGNGIPMLPAMQISRDAAGNVLLVEAIGEATEAVRAGESLAEPLGQSGLFGDDVVEMISVGESANNLAEVLTTIAETVEKRVDRMLTVFIRLMEPLLLLVLAGVVTFIAIALLMPMMQLSATM